MNFNKYRFFLISLQNIEEIKNEYAELKGKFDNLSYRELKPYLTALKKRISKLDFYYIDFYEQLEPQTEYDRENQVKAIEARESIDQIIDEIYNFENSSKNINSNDLNLTELKDDYEFIKDNERGEIPEDILIQKIKKLENTIAKFNLADLEGEDYDQILLIKKDISRIKQVLTGNIKSRKYIPLLKPILKDLLKKNKIIFKSQTENLKEENHFNTILDFLEIPQVLDFYETIIKRIINRTISPKALKSFIESIEIARKNQSIPFESISTLNSTLNSTLYSLNESFASQIDIENFANDLLEIIAIKILNLIKTDDISIINVPYTSINFTKYPELKKYLNDIYGHGIYIYFNAKNDKISGSFNRANGNIYIYFPIEYIKTKFNLNTLSEEQILLLFYDKSLTDSSLIDSLIHELQHWFDQWRSKGKAFQTKEYKNYLKNKNNLIQTNQDINNKDLYVDYLNLPHEISATFTETMSKMKVKEYGEEIPLNIFLNDFKHAFFGWDNLTPKIQKALIRKASNFWHKKREYIETNESNKMKTNILPLDEYLKLNEDFYNPFTDELETTKKEAEHLIDHGGNFAKKSQTFNLAKIEWRTKTGNKFSVFAKTSIAKGDIIEICPVILIPNIVKTIDTIRDLVFEIDKSKDEYGLVLGYGSLYAHSKEANVEYAYNKGQRLIYFIARCYIKTHEELTINYGTDYWSERDSLNMIKNIETKSKDLEESEIQPNSADIEAGKAMAQFSEPNSRINPVVSGVAIKAQV